MEVAAILGILAIFVLVGANAFFVAAEFSLVKVRATRIEQLAEEGSAAAGVVRGQLTHLDNYIAATQLGITLASLALGWIGEPALAHLVEPLLAPLTGTLIAEQVTRYARYRDQLRADHRAAYRDGRIGAEVGRVAAHGVGRALRRAAAARL